jgi:DNA-3-methyladenine glycosylase I
LGIPCSWSITTRNGGIPIHNDTKLFEFLVLEGAQAGLNWLTILKKRENYRTAFDHFDPSKIAKYSHKDAKRLLPNPGIIRNSLKINNNECPEIRSDSNGFWTF